jgi:DNA-binding response OmpR family regulator
MLSNINERCAMTETLLIVDPDAASQRAMVEFLKAGRYRTIAADGFAPAVQLLESARPDLLITVVRLGLFNGLQLVVRGRASNPRMAAFVVDDSRDPALERESKNIGATAYLAKPVDSDDLLQRIAEALASRERRRWSRTPVARNVLVLVRIAAGRARLLDISYGGVRLESGFVQLPNVLRLELPVHGLSVNAERVWSRRADPAQPWSCGAALASIDSESAQRWRRLVDTVRKGSASPSSSRPGH